MRWYQTGSTYYDLATYDGQLWSIGGGPIPINSSSFRGAFLDGYQFAMDMQAQELVKERDRSNKRLEIYGRFGGDAFVFCPGCRGANGKHVKNCPYPAFAREG